MIWGEARKVRTKHLHVGAMDVNACRTTMRGQVGNDYAVLHCHSSAPEDGNWAGRVTHAGVEKLLGVVRKLAAIVVDSVDKDKVRICTKRWSAGSSGIRRDFQRTHLDSERPSSPPRLGTSPSLTAPHSSTPVHLCARARRESAALPGISECPSSPRYGRRQEVGAEAARRASAAPTARGSSSTTLGLQAVSRAS